MMETPWPSIIICTIYFIFVANGKRIMKNREAMDLRGVLIVYNFSLVLLSMYLVYEVIFLLQIHSILTNQ